MLFISAAMLGMSGESFSYENKLGFFSRSKTPGVAPVKNPQYLEECGSCHFPYQPGLLPARSWRRMMLGLENHFGENAELPAEEVTRLINYLTTNAADHANYKRSKKIMKTLDPDNTPLRASKTPYFIKKHNQLSRKMVQNNPKVGSISKCDACHTKAETGSFSESEILIPNFGGWKD